MLTFDKAALPSLIGVIAVTVALCIFDWRYAVTFFSGALLGSFRTT